MWWSKKRFYIYNAMPNNIPICGAHLKGHAYGDEKINPKQTVR